MKYFLTFLILFIASSGHTQNRAHFGFQINGNLTSGITTVSDSISDYYKGFKTNSFCYSAGGKLEISISKTLNIQSGLLFRKSGDRSKLFPPEPLRSFPIGYIFNKFGIEVPLNVAVKMGQKSKFLVGGSVAYSLFSKHYFNVFNDIYKKDNSLHEIQPLDVYVNIGFEISIIDNFSLTAYSQFDLLKTTFHSWSTPNPARNYLSTGLTIGYMLN